MEQRIETTAGGVKQNSQDIEGLRQELRRMQSKLEEEREARDAALCEELRDRDMRRTNLIIHGLLEPAQGIGDNRERVEADRRLCGEVLATIGARTRSQDLRFCRRVGERGRDPRPLVIGIRTEEERRFILDRARLLQGTRFDNVAIVPDLTKMQRRAEDQLSGEAEIKNRSLTAEDREKNLRWLVVGRRGEKRLIKGVEHPPQRDRRRPQLGDFIQSSMQGSGPGIGNGGGGVGVGIGGGSGGQERDYANERAVGTRRKEYHLPLQQPNNALPHIPQLRLLEPINTNGGQYTPQQHRPVDERQVNGGGGPAGGYNNGRSNINGNNPNVGGFRNGNNRGCSTYNYEQGNNGSSSGYGYNSINAHNGNNGYSSGGYSNGYGASSNGYNRFSGNSGYNNNIGYGSAGHNNEYNSNRGHSNYNGYRSPPGARNGVQNNQHNGNRGGSSNSGYISPPSHSSHSNSGTTTATSGNSSGDNSGDNGQGTGAD
jgi:hypothetical protein